MTFQLGATLLEACVLSVLHIEDTYGYVLTQRIKTLTEVSESTLYPVLRRLQKEGLLSTYDEPCNGRNRRYYRLTAQGMEQLSVYVEEWQGYKEMVDKMLLGGNADEQN